MKGKRIFVTGASGFIGRHFLLQQKAENNNSYIFLTRSPEKLMVYVSHLNHQIIEGGIHDINKFADKLTEIDIIVYLAGEKSDENKMVDVNCRGFTNFLHAIQGVAYPTIIFLSSAGVYGLKDHPKEIIAESDECFPANTYEKSKLEAEHILFKFSETHGNKYFILRPSNVIGEYDSMRKLFTLINLIKKRRFFYIYPESKVNYVYAGYVGKVINQLLENENITSGIYNLNAPVNIKEFAKMITHYLKINYEPLRLPKFFAKTAVIISSFLPRRFRAISDSKYAELINFKTYSSDKIFNAIPLDPQKELQEGIGRLTTFYALK